MTLRRAMRSSAELLVEQAACRHCGYPVYNIGERWQHEGSSGNVGCRAASFDRLGTWDDTLDRGAARSRRSWARGVLRGQEGGSPAGPAARCAGRCRFPAPPAAGIPRGLLIRGQWPRPGRPAAWCAAGTGPRRREPARGTSAAGSPAPGSASGGP
jgi:hypothetical protein